MPVKVDLNQQQQHSLIDCSSFFDDLGQNDFSSEMLNFSLFDDFWMPTPPQSPPLKLTDDVFEDKTNNLDMFISHDCMWSGSCSAELCKSTYINRPISSTNRPLTPFNLSTSSNLSTNSYQNFDYNLQYGFIEEDSMSIEQQPNQEIVEHQQHHVDAGYGMANDHSYETRTAQRNTKNSTICLKKKSLIVKECGVGQKSCLQDKISQSKISKIKISKRISNKAKSACSILNTESKNTSITSNNALKRTKESTVSKPTIINVYSGLTQLTVKKKKPSINKVLDSNDTQHQMIDEKNESPCDHNMSAISINSPACSDSEESSLSSSSGDDPKNALQSPPVKRREHNDSERKRRDHLRNSFNNLKDQVPKLRTSEKRPPRIMILHEATAYVHELIEENEELEYEFKKEMERKAQLMQMLKRFKDCN